MRFGFFLITLLALSLSFIFKPGAWVIFEKPEEKFINIGSFLQIDLS